MHYVISTVIARHVKPTNVCFNSFSAVRDLQTIVFEACEVYTGDFSILIPGTLRRSNSDFSAHRMCIWRESATSVSYCAACWQFACALLEDNAHFLCITAVM